jgi:hypothetical protein
MEVYQINKCTNGLVEDPNTGHHRRFHGHGNKFPTTYGEGGTTFGNDSAWTFTKGVRFASHKDHPHITTVQPATVRRPRRVPSSVTRMNKCPVQPPPVRSSLTKLGARLSLEKPRTLLYYYQASPYREQ